MRRDLRDQEDLQSQAARPPTPSPPQGRSTWGERLSLSNSLPALELAKSAPPSLAPWTPTAHAELLFVE